VFEAPPVQPQPAERRRLRARLDAQRAILDATEALLVEEGYEAVSMRRLAARCGYTAPTIYHHFGDKPRLIDALLEERFRRLLAQVRRVPATPDPLERLRRLARTFVRFALRNPTHYRLLATPRPNGASVPPAAEQVREVLMAPVRELAERGRLEVPDEQTAQQSIWSLLHGLISLQMSRPDIAWSPLLVEHALDSLLRGLVRDGSRRRGEGRARA
jgi:AcrR family transcriptional regulator